MTATIEIQERPILFSGEMVRALPRKTQTRRVMKLETGAAVPADWHFCELNGLSNAVFTADEKTYTEAKNRYGDRRGRLWVRETWRIVGRIGSEYIIQYDADKKAQSFEVGFEGPTPKLDAQIHQEKFHPSIHMPRWASRFNLEITEVRVQRVQEISEQDAKADGIQVLPLQSENDPSAWYQSGPGIHQDRTARGSYRQLWNSIYAKPRPIKEKTPKGWLTTHYESFPWSEEDFTRLYPKYHKARMVRGKPLKIIANPWIWAITFKAVTF